MRDQMDCKPLVLAVDSIDDPIVAYAEFQKVAKWASERFRLEGLEVFRYPLEFLQQPLGNWFIKASKSFSRLGSKEEVFFNQPLVVLQDQHHSKREAKLYALGQTDRSRGLFVAFTIRQKLVRVISARDMNDNERRI